VCGLHFSFLLRLRKSLVYRHLDPPRQNPRSLPPLLDMGQSR
jgi:hypothetical protein